MGRKWFCAVVAALLAIGSWTGPTHAQDVCSNEAGRADRAVREQYQQSIDYFLRLAAAARAKGFDPRKFPQADPSGKIEVLDLVKIASDLTTKRDEAISAIYAGFQSCRNGVAPFQSIVQTTVFFLTGGMSSVVPNKTLFIDASNLLAGTPFGGSNALVPQFREAILAQLGISGPAADMIRNPLQISASGPIRVPWNPVFGPLGGAIPAIPGMPPIVNLPPIPSLPAPAPVVLGNVGGHRICIPWC